MAEKKLTKKQKAAIALCERKVAAGRIEPGIAGDFVADPTVENAARLRRMWEHKEELKPRYGLEPDVACELQQALS